MTTESEQVQWTVEGLLDLFDVEPTGTDAFVGQTGIAGADERQVVEGTQVLAQAIVAVAKRFPEKSVRSAYAVFARAVVVGPPVELAIDVVAEGRSTATAVVSVTQNGKRCITVTAFTDVPSADVIRHHLPRPDVAAPADGQSLRDADGRSPTAAGRRRRRQQPRRGRAAGAVRLAALRPDSPARDDLAKALIAYFTGHLGISTTMRAHEGIGTAQAHLTVSTAPMTISVSFHEPFAWGGWLLYTHESTQVGAGMSYVRGAVHTEEGELIASFAQDALIRPLRTTDTSIGPSPGSSPPRAKPLEIAESERSFTFGELDLQVALVGGDLGGGHQRRRVAGQPQHDVGDEVRRGQRVGRQRAGGEAVDVGLVVGEHLVHRQVVAHRGVGAVRVHRVDPNSELAQLDCQRIGQRRRRRTCWRSSARSPGRP